MRTVPANITTARQSGASTLAKCWRVERTDGEVFAFTEHDVNIVYGADTYLASSALSATAVRGSHDLSVDDLEAQGALDSLAITERDVLSGLWDGAAFRIIELDWTNPAAGADVLAWGWFGRIKTIGGRFVAELLGPTVKLQSAIGQIYQAGCRARLGDSRCTVSLAAHTATGEVSAVTTNRTFAATDGGSPAGAITVPSGDDSYWTHGLLTWTGGDNDGLEMEVASFDGTDMVLLLPMPNDVQVGDTFSIVAGCDHSLATCRDRFDNVLNFRGEPHAPVSDDVIRGP